MKQENRSPMIHTTAMVLIESSFMRYPVKPNVLVPSVKIAYQSNIEGRVGQGFLTLNASGMSKDNDELVFKAVIRYMGVFCEDEEKPNMAIEEFMKVNAPAQIYPFVREFLASLSTRSDMPPLILPPINMAALMEATINGEVKDDSIRVDSDDIK